jgi:hypothetical protein
MDWPSLETNGLRSKHWNSPYIFSGSCIPTKESLFILLALNLHWHRQFKIIYHNHSLLTFTITGTTNRSEQHKICYKGQILRTTKLWNWRHEAALACAWRTRDATLTPLLLGRDFIRQNCGFRSRIGLISQHWALNSSWKKRGPSDSPSHIILNFHKKGVIAKP